MNVSGRGSESSAQKVVIEWWARLHKHFNAAEICLFAIPNGGRRDRITGARLKQEGVRAGVPDLFLAVPAGGYHGLFVEMKRPRSTGAGSVSRAQKDSMRVFQDAGYACVVAHGAQEAIRMIEEYLQGDG